MSQANDEEASFGINSSLRGSTANSAAAISARPKVSLDRVDAKRLSFRSESAAKDSQTSTVGKLLVDALKGFFYVTSSQEMVARLMDKLEKVTVTRGQTLMTQGEKGDKM